MNTNQIISLRILALVATGKDIKDAINEVLGQGQFEQIASDIYDALNSK